MKVIQLKEGTDEFKAIKKQWQEQAGKATIDNIAEFMTDLTTKYQHDYGTICHAIAIAAKAAARAIDHSPQGGITGFQAGAIMWQFISEWAHPNNKTGMKLVNYDNFLYPQYGEKFEKTITSSTWEAIQKEAKAKIENADLGHTEFIANTEQYKKDIAAFIEKYPDYNERKEHYDPLGIVNGEQLDAEEKKKASGFEFAPQPPYEGVTSKSDCYIHWVSIVEGFIPFGYKLEK